MKEESIRYRPCGNRIGFRGRVESVFIRYNWGDPQEEVQKKPQLGTTQ
jgi:hypothetical protein